MRFTSSICVKNVSDKTLVFHLEPHGEQFAMPSGTKFKITADSEQPGTFEVEYGEGEMIVWAFPTAVVKIFCDGKEIGLAAGAERPAVPLIPDGQSVSSFLRSILGEN